jgi:hypothetical protein
MTLLLVGDSASDNLYVYEATLDLPSIATIANQELQSIAVSADGSMAYGVPAGGSTVQAFDLSGTPTPTGTLSLAGAQLPQAIALGGGNAYVSQQSAASLLVVSLNDPLPNPGQIPLPQTEVYFFAITPDGRWAICTAWIPGALIVTQLDQSISAVPYPLGVSPSALSLGTYGSTCLAYVCTNDSSATANPNSLLAFDVTNPAQIRTSSQTSLDYQPWGCALTPDSEWAFVACEGGWVIPVCGLGLGGTPTAQTARQIVSPTSTPANNNPTAPTIVTSPDGALVFVINCNGSTGDPTLQATLTAIDITNRSNLDAGWFTSAAINSIEVPGSVARALAIAPPPNPLPPPVPTSTVIGNVNSSQNTWDPTSTSSFEGYIATITGGDGGGLVQFTDAQGDTPPLVPLMPASGQPQTYTATWIPSSPPNLASQTVKATYTGDISTLGSFGAMTQYVNSGPPPKLPTTVTGIGQPNPRTIPSTFDSVSYVATVSPVGPTGTVKFTLADGTSQDEPIDSLGQAVWNGAPLPTVTAKVLVEYEGDATYAESAGEFTEVVQFQIPIDRGRVDGQGSIVEIIQWGQVSFEENAAYWEAMDNYGGLNPIGQDQPPMTVDNESPGADL